MSSLNKVILLGRLGHDPELKFTQNQTPVCNMSLATSDYFEKDGQKQEKTEWHKVVVFGKVAENCKKYLAKGRQIMIEGKLETRTWEKDGQKRYSTEIVANNVQFLGGPSDGQRLDNGAPAPGPMQPAMAAPPPGLGEVPF